MTICPTGGIQDVEMNGQTVSPSPMGGGTWGGVLLENTKLVMDEANKS